MQENLLLYIAIYCLLGSVFYIMGYQSGIGVGQRKAIKEYDRIIDRVTNRHKVDKNNDR